MSNLLVAGVDEVGRGPLAGPIIAAAVILGPIEIAGLTDSKKLSAQKRKDFALLIQQQALAYAYGRAEVEEIDTLNVHHANLLAMRRAIENLEIRPDCVEVDGLFIPPGLSMPATAIVRGDSLIPAISAASIIAKVLRDEEMVSWDKHYPGYQFALHKGYATEIHLEALRSLGPCPIHRKTFRRVSTRGDTTHATDIF